MEKGKGDVFLLVASLKEWSMFLFLVAIFPAGAGAAEFCATANTGSSFQSGKDLLLLEFTNISSLFRVSKCRGLLWNM
jgi:hypothetical protein